MALAGLDFGGLASLSADERIGLEEALAADNCILDRDIIEPRPGYRALTAAALVGVGSPQGVWRFRPSPTSARLVAGVAGQIFTVTDPGSETATGAAASAGTPFGAAANLSAAQLGRYLYIGTDESGVDWRRLDSSFALTALGSLAKVSAPTVTSSSLTVTKFATTRGSFGAPTLAGGATDPGVTLTDWYPHAGTVGGTVTYPIAAAGGTDWSAFKWLFVAMSPNTQGNGGGTVQVLIGDNSGNYASLGEVYDSPGNNSPYASYFSLLNLPSTINKTQIRYLRFLQLDTSNTFDVHGFLPVPSAPQPGENKYYLTVRNSTTGQESALSEEIRVTYSSDTITFPTFHAARWARSSFVDAGTASINPETLDTAALFNKGAGRAYPPATEFASIKTFSGVAPSGTYDKLRLYRLTEVGIQLVKEITQTSGAAYSVTDDVGDNTLTHEKWRAQGTPPRVNCLTARAQRLIGAWENRLYISSFVPTTATSDPYPQFPDIPNDSADGWSFDIAPSNIEQIQCLVDGDGLYILSNEACYVMVNLEPNSPPFRVFGRGALGRRSACWAEDRLFFASWDGLYAVANRAEVTELSQGIRRMWRDWLNPDSSTLVVYQNRRLTVFCGTRYLRYDFVRGRWTRGTVSHTFLHGVMFRDPTGTVQNLWMLTSDRKIQRWQPADVVGEANKATTDDGAALPAWVYSTGFLFAPQKFGVRSVFVEASGPVQIGLHETTDDNQGRVKDLRSGAHQEPMFGDLSVYRLRIRLVGVGGASVKRFLYELDGVDGEGA